MNDFDDSFMTYTFIADNFTQLFNDANRAVLKYGIETKPRNLKIKELINVSLTLTNPRARLLKSDIRKHSYKYAVAELLWYLRGSNSLDEIAFYAPSIKQYSDDSLTLNSAYGERIFGKHKDFPNQWENVKNKFLIDKDTRQGIININYSQDQNRQTKDVTCTLNLHFLIRDNKLILISELRSNDSMVGFIYDLFCFTMMQELFLCELKQYDNFKDLELGHYIHNAHSFHLYENHFEKVKNMSNENFLCDEMQPISHAYNEQVTMLQNDEKLKRLENKQIEVRKYEQPWQWAAIQLDSIK